MSGIATGTALLIGGGLAAGGSLGAAALESNAAGNAASTEANAADYAAQIQGQLGQESLANEVAQFEQGQANLGPFMQGGANSLATLEYLLGIGNGTASAPGGGTVTGPQTLSIPGVSGSVTIPGVTPLTGTANTNLGAMGSLMEAYPGGPFAAPTAAQAMQDPGTQFQMQEAQKAFEAGAAANGSLLTGGTLNAENQYTQNLASTNYQNVYNRALTNYNTNYNTWANQQANQFNRLAAIAGMGQTSAQQLTNAGLTSAGQVAGTLNATGAEIGQNLMNAAGATASGYMNSANAWGQGLTGATGNMSQLLMMYNLLNGGGGGSYPSVIPGVNNPSAIPNPYAGIGPEPGIPPGVYSGLGGY